MSSKRKREMIQTDKGAKDFDQKRLDDAISALKKSGVKTFSIEDVSIQESPPKITFISSSIRGSLYSKEETTLSFEKENEEWLISDIKTKSIEKKAGD